LRDVDVIVSGAGLATTAQQALMAAGPDVLIG
jgi:hypothetical protein